jgi:hypothetical protein
MANFDCSEMVDSARLYPMINSRIRRSKEGEQFQKVRSKQVKNTIIVGGKNNVMA